MRLVYAFDNVLPSRQTDGEQLVRSVDALSRRGVQVTLLLPQAPNAAEPTARSLRDYYRVDGPFEVLAYPGSTAPTRPLQQVAHARRAVARARALAPDLVYTRNLPMLHAGLSAGLPTAFEHYRPWGDQFPPLQPLLRRAMRHPRFLGTVLHSEHAAASYRRLGIPDQRLLVAHNGYDPQLMLPALSTEEARAQVGLPPGRPVVLYAGRVNARKGLEEVLELARRLPEVLFALVGSEGDGPIEQAARSVGNVSVFPWQTFDALPPWLYAADVLLLPPSLRPLELGNTVLPMKLFLYLAAGRAILAPEAPDTAELLRHDDNAALVPAGDLDAIAATLARLVDDGDWRARLAESARALSLELTWDRRAERIESWLQSRLASLGTPPPPAIDPWSARRWLAESARWLWRSLPRR
ncbi:MAG: glycosyltransferase [Deltaproteobacteria bacterium]|nr:glycosyltransferase [Deltaproteobacteria bacterium]MCB9787484.1 glycosyltransferase [Deltaproteobacteria bacterium]